MKGKIKLLCATSNKGKLREIEQIMGDIAEVISPDEAGICPDVEERGQSFEENAILKACAYRGLTDAVIIADDSGLVVDFLNGEPGIYSARYMGEDTSYDIKNENILERMQDAKEGERSARFVCAVAACLPSGFILCCQETMEGEIAYKRSGANGFGFDPIFYLPEYGMTSADISAEEKNAISHRGKALRKMYGLLKSLPAEYFVTGDKA